MIDLEAAEQTDLNPDAYALSETVKQLMSLVGEYHIHYTDLRQKFVEQQLHKPKLSFQTEIIADVEPKSEKVIQFDKLKEVLVRVAAQVVQLRNENAASGKQHRQAIIQLQNENASLRNELSSLRRSQFVGSSSFMSPENASSSVITLQSVVVTPKNQYSNNDYSPDNGNTSYSSNSKSTSPTFNSNGNSINTPHSSQTNRNSQSSKISPSSRISPKNLSSSKNSQTYESPYQSTKISQNPNGSSAHKNSPSLANSPSPRNMRNSAQNSISPKATNSPKNLSSQISQHSKHSPYSQQSPNTQMMYAHSSRSPQNFNSRTNSPKQKD
ncbi:hypothetical protein TRFO_30990 [Tritrichomonas foetus]|uniref:Uncharacterized protein n=1 Tax=Tritrichomonas foetus TaxID=1144522 RepID=A0A1J4JSJ8_9EUKA|nr:hypothetical protein TRFO_30990 [Tritrichomonas foetus]|eukprot:OHT02027.1 hypothetical protein TRFO_30990 [Tritrichomonas foetus]